MVLNCIAYGCSNVHNRNKSIAFHMFPFKRPDILKLWVTAIRRKDWHPSKTSRICGEHFLPSDYQDVPGSNRKILKVDAVPSIFNFPKHLLKVANPRKVPTKHVDTGEPMDVDVNLDHNLPSTSSKVSKTFVDTGVQTVENYNLVTSLKRKIKTLQQTMKRRDVKIASMKDVIKEISKSGYSNEHLNQVLQSYFEGIPLELVLLKKAEGEIKHPGQRRYSTEMKQFAHTLYFYSPKAYNFLKQYFVLPNGRTIRKWLSSVNCEPGILKEVLEYLKKEVPQNRHLNRCALIIDGMSIRKQVTWDDSQGKFTGNVDYGGLIDVDFEMTASEALFFEIVSYTTNFKCPVAYFLINKTDANVQAQIIQTILRSLHECGVIVKSITADGAQTNIATFKKLGCDLDPENIKPFFGHPCDSKINVHCILDPCHMKKLERNTFAEKCLTSPSGNISWKYIKELDNLQKKEGLMLANSLTSQHVNYKNKIMNVKLAVQTISSSVADAIEFLDKSGIKEFKDSSATVEFMRKMDRLFDMLNSRNPYEKGFKQPLRPDTIRLFEEIFEGTTQYIKTLKIDNIDLIYHQRKTFALGFIMAMKSTINLAKDLFTSEDPLKYFLTYKFSQDHLELFFSCIRARGGWNNNPNSQQLKWALRQLLFRNSIKASVSSNCSEFVEYCSPAFEIRTNQGSHVETENVNVNNLQEIDNIITYLHDKKLTIFQENVIYYISGYIVRSLIKQTTCNHCVEIMLYRDKKCVSDHEYSFSAETYNKFAHFASRGGLLYTSDIIYKIVNFLERQFRSLIEAKGIHKLNVKKFLLNSTLKHFSEKIHLFIPDHPINNEVFAEELHETQIVRKVSVLFLKCRLHHYSRVKTIEIHGEAATIRQKMSKLVLFKNC